MSLEAFLFSVLASLVAAGIVYLIRRMRGNIPPYPYTTNAYKYEIHHYIRDHKLVITKSAKIEFKVNRDYLIDYPSLHNTPLDKVNVWIEEYEITNESGSFSEIEGYDGECIKIKHGFRQSKTYNVKVVQEYTNFSYERLISLSPRPVVRYSIPLFSIFRPTKMQIRLYIHGAGKFLTPPFVNLNDGIHTASVQDLEYERQLARYEGELEKAEPKVDYFLCYEPAISKAGLSEIDRQIYNAKHKPYSKKYSKSSLAENTIVLRKGARFEASLEKYRILESVGKELVLVDNYLDSALLKAIHMTVKGNVYIICKTPSEKLVDLANALAAEWKEKQGEIFRLIDYEYSHARIILIDRTICYNSGSSVKDYGKKKDYIHPLPTAEVNEIVSDLIRLQFIPPTI